MFGFNMHKRVLAKINTDLTFTSAINIQGANNIAIEVDTFAVGTCTDSANVYAFVSNTSTTSTFKQLKAQGIYSAASGILDWEVPRTLGAYTVLCREAVGFNYLMLGIGQGSPNKTASAGLSCHVHIMQ